MKNLFNLNVIKHKYSEYIFIILLCLAVYIICIKYYFPIDTYYDIKAGEIFVHKGLLFHDIFSNSAYGRVWYPYEWLFQIGIYYIQHLMGLASVKFFVSIVSVIQIFFLYYFLKKLFKLPSLFVFLISIIYTVGISFFLIARPTLIANLFFIVCVSLILLYLKQNKNLLWIMIPIGLLWINLHASFILLLFLLGGYSFISFILFLKSKDKIWIQKAQILALYTLGIFLLSFIPPLFGTQYKLLWLFLENRQTLQTISEWQPLYSQPIQFFSFILILCCMLISGLFLKKRINHYDLMLGIPLGVLILLSFLIYRNLLFGWFAIAIFMSFTLAKLQEVKQKYLIIGIYLGTIILFTILYNSSNPFYYKTAPQYNPDKAASFILKYNLKGNMYNEYDNGDYLLYRLYPQQKVFIDARSDLYLCCELPEIDKYKLADISQNKYKKLFYETLDRHHIAFVLATKEEASQIQVNFLAQDPNWRLVFWDDNSQIFVRNHYGNDNIIKQFGTIAATPDSPSLYNKNQITQAINEYNRMIHVADSAYSRNILGVIYLDQNNLTNASKEFTKATQLDRTNSSAYVNLGNIALKEEDYTNAMTFYQQAIQLRSVNSLPYIYLGELYLKFKGDTASAKNTWQQGLNIVTDPNGRNTLMQLLNSN